MFKGWCSVLGIAHWRAAVLCAVSLGLAAGASGCGGSASHSGSVPGDGGGVSGGVVIRVGSQSISAAVVRHWTPIEAILSTEGYPKGPVAKGVVPDPPAYTACIGHLEALANAKPGSPKPQRVMLKRECKRQEAIVREHILSILITDLWVRGEAAAHHITASDEEARRRIRANLAAQFGNEAGFRKYLAYTGLTMGDELELYKKNLLTTKLLEKVLARPGMTARQKTRAYAEFVTRWVARTSCEPKYLVPDCKQYKGPLAPG